MKGPSLSPSLTCFPFCRAVGCLLGEQADSDPSASFPATLPVNETLGFGSSRAIWQLLLWGTGYRYVLLASGRKSRTEAAAFKGCGKAPVEDFS